MSTRDQNDQHDPHDKVLSSLYDNTKTEQPPKKLDDSILAASRREVQAKPRSRRSKVMAPFSGRWTVPVSIAAVLVLTVSIVTTVNQDPTDMVAPELASPKMDLQTSLNDRADAKEQLGRSQQQRTELEFEAKRRRPLAEKLKSAPVTPTRENAMAERSAPAESPAPKKSALAKQEKDLAEADLVEEDLIQETRVDSLSAKPESRALNQSLDQAAGLASSDTSEIQPATVARKPDPDQEKWLNEIELLIQQNKMEEAKKQFREFRKKYPDYVIEKLEKRFGKAFVDSVK